MSHSVKCHCGRTELDPEHAIYVINGTPCCTLECYDDALEAQGIYQGETVYVTYRKPQLAFDVVA